MIRNGVTRSVKAANDITNVILSMSVLWVLVPTPKISFTLHHFDNSTHLTPIYMLELIHSTRFVVGIIIGCTLEEQGLLVWSSPLTSPIHIFQWILAQKSVTLPKDEKVHDSKRALVLVWSLFNKQHHQAIRAASSYFSSLREENYMCLKRKDKAFAQTGKTGKLEISSCPQMVRCQYL